MAEYGVNDAMSAIDKLIAQQEAAASQKPTGIFGNVDPAMLGLARGFLSPTKTGGFGESIGLGLAGAEGPLAAMKKQQLDAQNKIQELQLARAKLAMEAPYYQARADYYGNKGLGGTEDSLSQKRLLIQAQQKSLEGKDWDQARNPDTGLRFSSEEEFNDFKDALDEQLFSLNRAARGVNVGGGAGAGTNDGGLPVVRSESDFKKLGPGVDFIYNGKRFTTPLAPPDKPRG